jgi:hypothetical protein
VETLQHYKEVNVVEYEFLLARVAILDSSHVGVRYMRIERATEGSKTVVASSSTVPSRNVISSNSSPDALINLKPCTLLQTVSFSNLPLYNVSTLAPGP